MLVGGVVVGVCLQTRRPLFRWLGLVVFLMKTKRWLLGVQQLDYNFTDNESAHAWFGLIRHAIGHRTELPAVSCTSGAKTC